MTCLLKLYFQFLLTSCIIVTIIYVTLTKLLSGAAVSLYGLICVGSVLDLDWLLVADNEYYIHVNDLLLTEVTSCWATNNSTFNCSIRTFRNFFSSRRLLHSFSQTQSLALFLPGDCSILFHKHNPSLLINFLDRSFTLCFDIYQMFVVENLFPYWEFPFLNVCFTANSAKCLTFSHSERKMFVKLFVIISIIFFLFELNLCYLEESVPAPAPSQNCWKT